MRKDVTPKPGDKRETTSRPRTDQKTNSTGKQIGLSLIGGVVGGLLAVGGYVAVDTQTNLIHNDRAQVTTTIDNGKNTVSTTNVNVSSDVTKAVEKVQDAVVSVKVFQKNQQQLSDFERLFGQQNAPQSDSLEESSEGSGVIYRTENDKAFIVTNNHVVAGADAVSVLMADGKTVDAKIVGTDVYSDLAVLEIGAQDIKTVAEFGNSDDLKVGEPVLAIGSPLGSVFANSVSQGIVSAKNRMITNQTEDGQVINSKAIQTDAAINPGNSGGALINIAGQVIGINSSKIASAATGVSAEGLGFAIPSNEVVGIINQLEQGKQVARPMLGIRMVDLSALQEDDKKNILKLDTTKVTDGVVIASVEKSTPAEAAGLKQYDVITQLDGEEVTSTADLQLVLYSKKIGDPLEVTYYRDGKEEKTTVQLTMDSSEMKLDSQNNSSAAPNN